MITQDITNLIEEARRQDKMLRSGALSLDSTKQLLAHASQQAKTMRRATHIATGQRAPKPIESSPTLSDRLTMYKTKKAIVKGVKNAYRVGQVATGGAALYGAKKLYDYTTDK